MALYAKERTSRLTDNTISHVSEFSMRIIDKETHTFKNMLLQLDKAEFVAAMDKEVSIHERRNHWEGFPRSEIP